MYNSKGDYGIMVNYPNGKKATNTSLLTADERKFSASRRGMELEKEINQTNDFYLKTDVAVIHKKPTPVTIVHVDYPKRSAAKITEAYFKLPSTTDYNGIYRGKYIDFEAKDNQLVTSFPLKSIHEHQIQHLQSVVKHGAIAFVIVRFVKRGMTYYCPAEKMIPYIRKTDRSSIPYEWFVDNCYLIPKSFTKPVDYLKVIDRLYFAEGENA